MVKQGEIRKEVHLTEKVIKALEKQAAKEKRTLKNYMELILILKAESNGTKGL